MPRAQARGVSLCCLPEVLQTIPAKTKGKLVQVRQAAGEMHKAAMVLAMNQVVKMTYFMQGDFGGAFQYKG